MSFEFGGGTQAAAPLQTINISADNPFNGAESIDVYTDVPACNINIDLGLVGGGSTPNFATGITSSTPEVSGPFPTIYKATLIFARALNAATDSDISVIATKAGFVDSSTLGLAIISI